MDQKHVCRDEQANETSTQYQPKHLEDSTLMRETGKEKETQFI